jgi:hypothetical protein
MSKRFPRFTCDVFARRSPTQLLNPSKPFTYCIGGAPDSRSINLVATAKRQVTEMPHISTPVTLSTGPSRTFAVSTKPADVCHDKTTQLSRLTQLVDPSKRQNQSTAFIHAQNNPSFRQDFRHVYRPSSAPLQVVAALLERRPGTHV